MRHHIGTTYVAVDDDDDSIAGFVPLAASESSTGVLSARSSLLVGRRAGPGRAGAAAVQEGEVVAGGLRGVAVVDGAADAVELLEQPVERALGLVQRRGRGGQGPDVELLGRIGAGERVEQRPALGGEEGRLTYGTTLRGALRLHSKLSGGTDHPARSLLCVDGRGASRGGRDAPIHRRP